MNKSKRIILFTVSICVILLFVWPILRITVFRPGGHYSGNLEHNNYSFLVWKDHQLYLAGISYREGGYADTVELFNNGSLSLVLLAEKPFESNPDEYDRVLSSEVKLATVSELRDCFGGRGYTEGDQLFPDSDDLVDYVFLTKRASKHYPETYLRLGLKFSDDYLIMYNDTYIRFLNASAGSHDEMATDFIYSVTEMEGKRMLKVDRAIYKGYSKPRFN